LPENQKTVIVLLKIEQLSQQETAIILNLSSKAVESLFQRAKKNLQQILTNTKEHEK
jgi:RNA polymerase sigma-70 factor (ECF subfamily)